MLNISIYAHAFDMFCIGFLVSSIITVPYVGMFIAGMFDLFKSNHSIYCLYSIKKYF